MAFQPGNKESVKLDTDEMLIEAYQSYCAHLAKGKGKMGWFFIKDGIPLCGWQTMEKYINQRQDVLKPIHKQCAESKSYDIWESIVDASAKGDNKKANTASLQMVMRNKFGWDAKNQEDPAEAEKKADLEKFSARAKQTRAEYNEEQSKDRTE